MIPALAALAGAVLVAAAVRQGCIRVQKELEQVAQGLAGAHSAAFDALKAHIEVAASELVAKTAKIAELETTVADLTAKLEAASAPVGTSDEDLAALDGVLKPALDSATESVTEVINSPVTA